MCCFLCVFFGGGGGGGGGCFCFIDAECGTGLMYKICATHSLSKPQKSEFLNTIM